MKVIPTKDFIELVTSYSKDLISELLVCQIFKEYGDDYYKDSSDSNWEKVVENEKRIEMLR